MVQRERARAAAFAAGSLPEVLEMLDAVGRHLELDARDGYRIGAAIDQVAARYGGDAPRRPAATESASAPTACARGRKCSTP